MRGRRFQMGRWSAVKASGECNQEHEHPKNHSTHWCGASTSVQAGE